ncbi:MAG TPA: serine hydrolase domain-containing protein [Croceibacterium sp.]
MRAMIRLLLVAALGFAGSANARSTATEQQIDAAVSAMRPATQIVGRSYPAQSLTELMRQKHVPGASIVVFHDGRIVYAKGFGLAEAGGTRAVTPETLFQAASISKPLTATAALRLVEQGRLDLDRPVNDRLRSWRIPESPAAEGKPVTLRELLTHTAGVTVHGFPGYAAGAPRPTLLQVLDGVPPANTPAVRVDQRPGSAWRYSGGGFTIVQLLLTETTGQTFADLMRRLVLAPAGMSRSTYAQPLPEGLRPTAAMAYRPDGSPIAGGYHIYPEQAAAGLWTTPSDLARWALALSASFNGRHGGLLRHDTAVAMLTPGLGNWGLGIGVGGEGEWLSFTHDGANEGYRADLLAYPRRGDGMVIMTNSDSGDELFGPLRIAVGHALGWPHSEPQTIVPVAVPAQALAEVAGRYMGFGQSLEVRPDGDMLLVTIAKGPPPFHVIPQGNDDFVAEDGLSVKFIRDPATKRVTGLAVSGGTLQRTGDGS